MLLIRVVPLGLKSSSPERVWVAVCQDGYSLLHDSMDSGKTSKKTPVPIEHTFHVNSMNSGKASKKTSVPIEYPISSAPDSSANDTPREMDTYNGWTK